MRTSPSSLGEPPGTWRPARALVRRAIAPVERFLAIEASSGIVLLATAVLALAWANSPWRESYHALWHLPLGVQLGPWSFERDLHFWVNDGLMTLFFFVVGLEIRRELHQGELSELRRAALPFAAALGGMAAPAALFAAINLGRESMAGWAIPTATDIAFAVGVLAVLGRRVPPALRVLLLAIAVIDDVGAILIIALVYSSGLGWVGFLVAGLGLAGILALKKVGVRSPWAYVLPAVVVWAGAYAGGIHPTLAGVVVGLLTPARAWLGREAFVARAEETLAAVRAGRDEGDALLTHVEALAEAGREAVAPVHRVERALHGWVAFGVMPLFALANAGVSFGAASLAGEAGLVFAGVLVGLVVGKPLGVVGAAWLATRLGWAALPWGVTWPQVLLVGLVAGIGFTMSIFIGSLAFAEGGTLETAKLAILAGSGAAAAVAYGFGLAILPSTTTGSAAEAEASTEL